MTLSKILLTALALPATVMAQHLSHPVMASRDDAFSAPRSASAFPDTVRVLAVMVQFRADNNPATTGNGRFDLSPTTAQVLDSPPHNAGFFRDHLAFLENYFRRASKGKTIVTATLLDSLFTLTSEMNAYSPAKNAPNTAVVNLARDTWMKVDSSGLVPDFSLYNCFVVFHAGVGHDIDLVSVLGYDPGPSDIPSLFIGPSAFKQAYGYGYDGIPVNGGLHLITNSIILPETESRSIPAAVGGNALLQYTFSGLLCASVGNYLGLPDLYDTQNGSTAIGRFGLMDGAAIFSFNGAFPPQPSAWEKYWLGWISPIIVPSGTTALSLPAVEVADTVYRIPISNSEYFLVENRNRNPRGLGLTMTWSYNGAVSQRHFVKDTAGFDFESGDLSLLYGVVTDVDEPDWSLPGGVATDGTFYDGGVLIWHIDEAVILANIAADAVNTNIDHRGVDVEEADGSQDIGQSYGLFTAASGSENGTALDYWYSGNPAPVYKNRFSETTFPDSRSYSGAKSHITVRDFSIRGPHMSAFVDRGDGQISVLPGFPRQTGYVLAGESSITVAGGVASAPVLFAATSGWLVRSQTINVDTPAVLRGNLFAWSPPATGGAFSFSPSGLIARAGPDSSFWGAPAAIDTNRDGIIDMLILGEGDRTHRQRGLTGFALRDANGDSLIDLAFRSSTYRKLMPEPTAGDSLIAMGADTGWVYFFRFGGALVDSAKVMPDGFVSGISVFSDPNSFVATGDDGSVTITTRRTTGGTVVSDRTKKFGKGIIGPAVTETLADGTPRIAFVTSEGMLYLVDAALTPLPGFPVNVGTPVTRSPVMADIDGDGRRDVVVFAGSKIYAVNEVGSSLDYFPYNVPSQLPFLSPPVVADVDGDGLVDIVGVTGEGLVVAVNRRGAMAAGFPLLAGPGNQSAAVYTRSDSIILAVGSSDDGSVSAWVTGRTQGAPDPSLYPWPQYQHDPAHRGLDRSTLQIRPLSSDFFPKDRAYNWPNPVYAGKTRLRYFVRDNATVNIKVFDIAGDLVTSFPGPGIGGMDNEIEWDVSGIESGVYLARIEATSPSASGVVIVKVAVVK